MGSALSYSEYGRSSAIQDKIEAQEPSLYHSQIQRANGATRQTFNCIRTLCETEDGVMKMAITRYKGRLEESSGKFIFRYRAEFKNHLRAKEFVAALRRTGKICKLVRYTDGYAVYEKAKHDFVGRRFHVNLER